MANQLKKYQKNFVITAKNINLYKHKRKNTELLIEYVNNHYNITTLK